MDRPLHSGVLRSVAVVLALVTLSAYASMGAAGADADEIPAWRGRWNTEAELTIEPRTDGSVAVAAGTPHGVVVWGGVAQDGRLLNDGLLIDSADPSHWRVMPESPLAPRRDYGWASVGDRVLVWGGVDEDGRPLDDGALFQHGWMSLPQSRMPGGPASMAVADYRLWVVATDPDTGLAKIESMGVGIEDGASWGLVADVPLPSGERYEVAGCCGDEVNELIVFSIMPDGSAVAASWNIGAARAPDFIGGEWTQLGTIPAPVGAPVVGRAIEQQLAAWVSPVDPAPADAGDGSVAVLRQVGYGQEEQWRTAPSPGRLGVASGLVLSPRHLISLSDRAVYDLADERWLRLPELHRRASFATPTGAATWWDRGRLWVLGGVAPDGTMRSDSPLVHAAAAQGHVHPAHRPDAAVEDGCGHLLLRGRAGHLDAPGRSPVPAARVDAAGRSHRAAPAPRWLARSVRTEALDHRLHRRGALPRRRDVRGQHGYRWMKHTRKRLRHPDDPAGNRTVTSSVSPGCPRTESVVVREESGP